MKLRSIRKSEPTSRAPVAARTSGVLARVRRLQTELPPTARRIASFIDGHAEEVIRMSITELAEVTEASEGSIVGLCRRLFEAYVKNLKAAGKSSWPEAEAGLNKIAIVLGRNRLARDITPEDVLGVLRAIYERGKRAMADHVRSYIRSAYSWASNPRMTIGARRLDDSNSSTARQVASPPSRRSSVRVGSMRTSLSDSTVGWSVPMHLCTRRTPVPFVY
jgi:Helix-turn-helix domain, rpiR family